MRYHKYIIFYVIYVYSDILSIFLVVYSRALKLTTINSGFSFFIKANLQVVIKRELATLFFQKFKVPTTHKRA